MGACSRRAARCANSSIAPSPSRGSAPQELRRDDVDLRDTSSGARSRAWRHACRNRSWSKASRAAPSRRLPVALPNQLGPLGIITRRGETPSATVADFIDVLRTTSRHDAQRVEGLGPSIPRRKADGIFRRPPSTREKFSVRHAAPPSFRPMRVETSTMARHRIASSVNSALTTG